MSTNTSPEDLTCQKADDPPPLALIAGPTASGKSELAVRLAQEIEKDGRNAAIINADSAQVYSDLHVLSARPDETEMAGIEHRLFGSWDGSQPCSAADWSREAKREIAKAHSNGAIPILCGGTGLYIRTLIEGIAPIPEIRADIREEVRSLSTEEAYAALAQLDPERHRALNPGDGQRIARALEVIRSTGRTLGDWQRLKSGGIAGQVTLRPLILLPDRAWLYERCDRRFETMLDAGAIEEVEALLSRGLNPDLPVMNAIGVQEIAAWLRKTISRDTMIAQGQQATRNYAKRQFTWFRRQPPVDWQRIEQKNYDSRSLKEFLLQK